MKIFDEILNSREFNDKPPVLIDIGASFETHGPWQDIAKYSICLAFDADKRGMNYARNIGNKFKNLFVHESIASSQKSGQENFYLTASPACSSTLEPNSKTLADWSINELFKVLNKTVVKSEHLVDALEKHSLDYIDWFKTDSQGTDLRLLQCLGDEKIRRILSVDLEPGIIDAYIGEDKAHIVIEYMSKMPFWMDKMKVMGVRRFSESVRKQLPKTDRDALGSTSNEAPGWTEISYLNNMSDKSFGIREYLLMWIFATIKGHDGFALEIAMRGEANFDDKRFAKLQNESKKTAKIRRSRLVSKRRAYVVINTMKRIIKRIIKS